jgi:hypothetical protein
MNYLNSISDQNACQHGHLIQICMDDNICPRAYAHQQHLKMGKNSFYRITWLRGKIPHARKD